MLTCILFMSCGFPIETMIVVTNVTPQILLIEYYITQMLYVDMEIQSSLYPSFCFSIILFNSVMPRILPRHYTKITEENQQLCL